MVLGAKRFKRHHPVTGKWKQIFGKRMVFETFSTDSALFEETLKTVTGKHCGEAGGVC
jgi:hypothetical protein